jgi:fatty acid desaturase
MPEELTAQRDYTLTGPEGNIAIERGLAGATWYLSPIQREELLSLMARRNSPAAFHTVLWIFLLIGSGAWLWLTWMSWWTIPAAFLYGTLYGSASDARWHECGHRTAFASKRANDIVYYVASFMDIREPVSWRWSHHRHHADTIIVGRDPEIAYPRPTPFWKIILDMFGIISTKNEFRKYAYNIAGRLTPEEATYVPQRERVNAIRWGRIHAAALLGIVACSVSLQSLLPLMLFGLPSLYGRWLLVVFGTTQHAGLAEDVLDHRFNTRTVLMGPVLRFLYLNMNYHLEHHMYPAVPYHSLPQLHDILKDDLPHPYPNMRSAYRDILPALRRQQSDRQFFLSPKWTHQ